MSENVIFKNLPATFPEKDRYQKPSVAGSVIFHGVLIAALIVVPLLIPGTLSNRELLITLVAPIAPPPPPPPPQVEPPVAVVPHKVKTEIRPVTSEAVIMPTVVPKEIVKIIDVPPPPAAGVTGGVPGGIPGGVSGGVLGGILSNANATILPAPLPPPPPPPPKIVATGPVRVGGSVREPKPIKMVPPVYPVLASRARVSGVVVLEATLTAQGTVSEIRVISGHPLLIQAAMDCVKQWQYEPTLLNGSPVPVILTARVTFSRAPIS
jgi:protein TonB